MPRQRKSKPPQGAGPEVTKKDFDAAVAKGKELGVRFSTTVPRFMRQELFSILIGQARDQKTGYLLPDPQQLHPWFSHEDADYILKDADKYNWYAEVTTEVVKLNRSQLRNLINEALGQEDFAATVPTIAGNVRDIAATATREIEEVYNYELDDVAVNAIEVDIRLALMQAVNNAVQKVYSDIDSGGYNA